MNINKSIVNIKFFIMNTKNESGKPMPNEDLSLNGEKLNDENFWDDYKAMEGNMIDIPDIEEDEEYDEMMATYIDKVYAIKIDLELLISDLSYFNTQREGNEKNYVKEIGKLKEVLETITDLYGGEIYVSKNQTE